MSSDQEVNIVINAQNSSAMVGISQFSQAFEQNFAQINHIFADFSKNTQQAFKQINQNFKVFGEFAEKAGQGVDGLGNKVRNWSMVAGLMQPAINLFTWFNQKIQDVVDTTMSWNASTNRLSQTLGITTREAGGLSKALERLDISTDSYKGAVFSLQRSLDSQEEAFNRNGIVTRKTNGELLGMQDIMMNTLARLREMKPGYDANALAIMAFGESAKDLQGLMNLTNKGISEGIETTKKLGITVGEEGTAVMNRYRDAMNAANESMEAVKIQVGNALLPVMADAKQRFADIAQQWAGPVSTALSGMAKLFSNTAAQITLAGIAAMATAPKIAAMLNAAALARFKTALLGLLNPWSLVTAAIIAGAYGLHQWITTASRAASENAKLTQSLVQNRNDFLTYSEQLKEADAALAKTTEGANEHKEALAKKNLLLNRLNSIYPGFNQFLTDEAGNNRSLAEAIRMANEAQLNSMKIRLVNMEAQKAELKAAYHELKPKTIWSWNPLDVITVPINTKRLEDTEKAFRETWEAAEELRKSVLGLENLQSASGNKGFAGASNPGGVTPPAGGAQGQFDLMAAYSEGYRRRYLADLEAVTEEQAAAYERRLADEMSYWKGCLAYAEAGTNEYAAIEQKILDIGIQINEKRIADHKRMLDEKAADDKRAAAEAETERKSSAAARKLAAEQEAREAAAHWKTFYAPMANGYKDALYGMLNGSMNFSDGYKRVLQGMGQALDQFIVEALSSWFSAESKKFIATVTGAGQRVAVEEGASGAIGAAKAVEGAGHETIEIGKTASTAAGAASRTSASLGESLKIIASKAGEGLKHAAVEIGKTMATVAGTIKRVAAVSWEVLTSVALKIWEGLKFVFIEGFQAAAGAFKALVGIPYIGPILAPAAAIAAIAAVASFGSKIASAAGGWGQVPYDQMAMVHKNEMVLPARFAAPLREMLTDTHDGPGAGGGDTYNISIHAIDARSFEQYLKSNRNALVRNIKGATRDNAFFS